MGWKLWCLVTFCSLAACFATNVEQAIVHGKISFIGKKLDKIPKGSCLMIKVQDTRIADAPSIDIATRVWKGKDLQLHDGAMVYNVTFTKPEEATYTISATLNMGWCQSGGSDWLKGGDYLTTSSFDFDVGGKKSVYESNIELEYYEKPAELVHKRHHHRHHKHPANENDDPCYHAPCVNSICTSFANGSYACRKVESLPCAVPMCADMYAPICGSNGKTYSNECLMESESCIDGIKNDLHKVHDGECYSKHFMHEGFLLGASVISLATVGLVAVFFVWRRNRLVKLRRMSPYGMEKVAPLGL